MRAIALAICLTLAAPSVLAERPPEEGRAEGERTARFTTETIQVVSVTGGILYAKSSVRGSVDGGGVKELRIALPEGATVYKVVGAMVEDWTFVAKTDDAQPHVRVQFHREMKGSFAVELNLESAIPTGAGAPVAVPLVRPLGANGEGGIVVLQDAETLGFGRGAKAGYTEVDEHALPEGVEGMRSDRMSQVLRHAGPPSPMTSTIVAARRREVPLFGTELLNAPLDVRVRTLYTLNDASIVALAEVLVDARSAPVAGVAFIVPKEVTVRAVVGPCIARTGETEVVDAGEGRKAFGVGFTQEMAEVLLDVTFDVPLAKQPGRVVLPDLRVFGAKVEHGSVGIAAGTGIDVRPVRADNLNRVDVKDLPAVLRIRTELEPLMGWQFTGTPWRLELEVGR